MSRLRKLGLFLGVLALELLEIDLFDCDVDVFEVLRGVLDEYRQLALLDLGDGASAAMPPLRGVSAAAASAFAASPGQLTVEVGRLALTPAIRQDMDIGDVYVEVDLLGLVDPSQLATQIMHKGSAPLDFKFAQAVTIAPGSREQSKLRAALTSAIRAWWRQGHLRRRHYRHRRKKTWPS